jgi:hypothetical protein
VADPAEGVASGGMMRALRVTVTDLRLPMGRRRSRHRARPSVGRKRRPAHRSLSRIRRRRRSARPARSGTRGFGRDLAVARQPQPHRSNPPPTRRRPRPSRQPAGPCRTIDRCVGEGGGVGWLQPRLPRTRSRRRSAPPRRCAHRGRTRRPCRSHHRRLMRLPVPLRPAPPSVTRRASLTRAVAYSSG